MFRLVIISVVAYFSISFALSNPKAANSIKNVVEKTTKSASNFIIENIKK